MEKLKKYYVIGIMSGTSLDGLDIAYCEFDIEHALVRHYSILEAETIPYANELKTAILSLENSQSTTFLEWDRKIGVYFGQEIFKFIKKYAIKKLDFVASHGHTIFHQPSKGFTVQIGHGAAISSQVSLPVVCDFRSLDVSLGGQGAPLVPVGDKILFANYDFCLNLGGIANISYLNKKQIEVTKDETKSIAFDICVANMALNYFAKLKNAEYDKDGNWARNGNLNTELLNELNNLSFFYHKPPKSLGKEWFLEEFMPILDKYAISVDDKLKTVCEHIAIQISKSVLDANLKASNEHECTMLVTGGGAFNHYLIERISYYLYSKVKVIIPNEKTVMFKEALIFALLGVLRWEQQVNCLASVTGASKNNIGGAIYWF
jgi:anhydro-N-acetylmuramic acid kinase